MALFGKKNEDNSSENIEDLDAKILAAIEETDAEEEQRKVERRQAEAERVANRDKETEVPVTKTTSDVKHIGRRFFLMPTETEVGDNLIKATGAVFGQANVGDKVYIYRPNGQVVMSSILSITPAGGEEQTVPEGTPNGAKNTLATLELGFKFANVGFEPDNIIPSYSVLTNVQPSVPSRRTVENPAILGLTLLYNKYGQEKDFNRVLVNHMVNTSFMVPVYVKGKGADGNPSMQIITLEDNENKVLRNLPIFTDAVALKSWKEFFGDSNKPTVAILTFQEITKIISADKLSLIINPYGPIAVKIPFDFVNKLTKSESYINRFGEDGEKRKKYRKENVTDGSKIAVGVPPQIEEVKAIRQAIKNCCSGYSSVKTAGLLCKVKKGEKPGYLCIVDCPKADARDVFTAINAAVKPFLNKITKIEFSRYEETIFADQYFSNEPFDYVKNPNQD